MEEAGTINFQDAGDADEGVVIVRYDEKTVAIRVSKARTVIWKWWWSGRIGARRIAKSGRLNPCFSVSIRG